MQRDGGPGGAGGAGNPTGGSFTGPAEALEIVGNHAYAYSGSVQASTSNVQHLNFTSGNYLFVGELTLIGPLNIADVTDGAICEAEISFNGNVIFKLKTDTTQEDMPAEITIPFLIPSYTQVLIDVKSSTTSAGFLTTVNLIGRIYRE